MVIFPKSFGPKMSWVGLWSTFLWWHAYPFNQRCELLWVARPAPHAQPACEIGVSPLQPQGMGSPWDFITRRSEKEHLKAEKSGTNVALVSVKPTSPTHIQGHSSFSRLSWLFLYTFPSCELQNWLSSSIKKCHWVFFFLELCWIYRFI